MSASWVGLRRIIEAPSDFVFRVEHVIMQEAEDVHVTRIKPYVDTHVEAPVQMKQIAEFSDRVWYFVDKIENIREVEGKFEVFVSWQGLTTAGDS